MICDNCKQLFKTYEAVQLTLSGKYSHLQCPEKSLFDVWVDDLKKMRYLTWDINDGFFWHVADIDEFSPEEERSFKDMCNNAPPEELNLRTRL